jgi:thermitase
MSSQRRLTVRLLICVLAVISGAPVPAHVGASSPPVTVPGIATADAPYVPGEVLIGWRPLSGAIPQGSAPKGFAEDRADRDWQDAAQVLADRTGLEVLDAHPYYGTARLAVPPGEEWAEIQRLEELPWVEYAEPNYIARAAGQPVAQDLAYYPNDPYIGDQWNMRRIGAPEAWDVTKGSYSIVVAVLDTGIDVNHPEFAGHLISPAYDYVNADSDPSDDDINSHGTHVAGILAATADNGLGVTGLAPSVKILPLKVLDSNGVGTYANIALATRQAALRNVDIINLSLGGAAADFTLRDAVAFAVQQGTLVVAAAGNAAQRGNADFYPAAYPEVFAVAASDHYDNWAAYSGHKAYIALAAPGGISANSNPDRAEYEIRSTVRVARGGYGFEYGTSMATSLVSAAAALVWTFMPLATPAEVTQVLKNTADKIGTDPETGTPIPYVNGRNDYFGYGRLNAARAVRWAYPPSLNPVTNEQHFMLGGSASQQSHQLLVTNPSERPVSWEARVTAGESWLQVYPVADTSTFSSPAVLTLQAGPTTLGPGYYRGTIDVRTTSGSQSSSFQIAVSLQMGARLWQDYVPSFGKQAPAESWIDPVAGGQPLPMRNNSAYPLDLPFQVPFYGKLYSQVWVSDNGFVSFGERYLGPAYNQPTCLPSAAGPNNAIYAQWEDLDPDRGGKVYAQQVDTDRFVITWYQVPRPDGTTPQSFQIVLSRSGVLRLQYAAIDSSGQGTIGIENHDGTVAQQILCRGSGRKVWAGDVLTLNPVLPW